MSDVGPQRHDAPEADAPSRAPLFLESGIFRDPMVRNMTYVAMGLVVVFLATVVGALATGVVAPAGPRSVAERELLVAANALKVGAVGDAWAPYIDALVLTGDLGAARAALAQARASVVTTEPALDLDLSEARLLSAEKRYADAAEMAGKAMKGYKGESDALIAKGGETGTEAKAAGPVDGYFEAALLTAYSNVNLRRYGDAVKMFDIYIERHPTAADVLVDRGNAKAEMEDTVGAEKDFRKALTFVPYDEEAKAGLKRIGVTQ